MALSFLQAIPTGVHKGCPGGAVLAADESEGQVSMSHSELFEQRGETEFF